MPFEVGSPRCLSNTGVGPRKMIRAIQWLLANPDPKNAKSDGPNAVPLHRMKELLETLLDLDRVAKRRGFIERDFA